MTYCPHCKFIETLGDFQSNREYWLITEIFVYLHNGKDYCDFKGEKMQAHMENFEVGPVVNFDIKEAMRLTNLPTVSHVEVFQKESTEYSTARKAWANMSRKQKLEIKKKLKQNHPA